MPMVSRTMLEECSYRMGSAQKSSIIKWKWLMQGPATGGMQSYSLYSRAGRLFSLSTDFGITQRVPDSPATWTVPYKLLLIDQQRAVWLTGGSSKVNKQHTVWKAANLIGEGKSKSALRAELHTLCHSTWIFTDSWAAANGLAIWSGRRAMETWSIRAMPSWSAALWESLQEF